MSEEEKLSSARTMAVYAAMIDYMDNQISRVFDWLRANGEMENTMIVFFSDNGANAAPATTYPGQTQEYLTSFNNKPSNIGLPGSYVATGPSWAAVSSYPYKLFKGFTTEGGIKSPCIVSLPESHEELSSIKSFTHVSDLFPTILEMASIPESDEPKFNTLIGASLIPLFKGEGQIVRNEGIGYELFGNRAYFEGDWKLVSTLKPFGSGEWELYNLDQDPFERVNLAEEFPDEYSRLIKEWKKYSENVNLIYDPLQVPSQLLKRK